MHRVRVVIVSAVIVLALSSFGFCERGIKIQENRIALVIGNGQYKSAPLKNPINDATDMANALKKLGFTVTLKPNANQRTMERAIRDFGKKLKSGGVGLFYYAGHGLQVYGHNYLIPIDAEIESEGDVKYESVDAGLVLAKMEDAENNLNIIILDACRDNPFARSFRSSEKGLAKMDAPTGSFLAYATAPGSVAKDGVDRNGLYTSKLLEHMMTPGLTIERIFKSVRIAVMQESEDRQVPWESSSLTGDFYFNPKGGIAVADRPPNEMQSAVAKSWQGKIKEPSNRAAEQIIFNEDFNNNTNDWLIDNNQQYAFQIQNGKYILESKNGGIWITSKPIQVNTDLSFKIECQVEKISGVENFGFGLIWGAKDVNNRYEFAITGNGQYLIGRYLEPKYDFINTYKSWVFSHPIAKYNSMNKLTIEKIDNRMQFFINDKLVDEIPFQPFLGPFIGFVINSGKDTIKIAFDGLLVSQFIEN